MNYITQKLETESRNHNGQPQVMLTTDDKTESCHRISL